MKPLVRALTALVAVCGIAVGSHAAQAPDVSGRWDVVLNAPDGAHKATLNLKKDGAKLTGTIGNNDGEIPSAANSGASAAAQTGALDISGAWQFEVSSPAGTGTPTITFNQSGEKLTGQYVGQLGEAPIQGTLKGSELTFSLDVSFQDTKFHIVYTGTATKDALKGTASFGDLGEGTFTARRK